MSLPILADFAKETTTVTGTGNVTLLGVRNAATTIGAVVAVGETFHYAISHQAANEWEVGLGTMLSSTTFARTNVLASSNGGAAVNFSAGTKSVDLVVPASRFRGFVGPIQIGATTLGNGTLSFSDGGGVSFGLSTNTAGGTITASAAAGGAATRELGLVSHVGGNSIASVSRLAFSNDSNVSFSLSTNGSGVTVRASVVHFMNMSATAAFATNSITLATDTTFSGSVLHLNRHAENVSHSYQNVHARFTSDSLFMGAWFLALGSSTAGAVGVRVQQFSMANGNGVTFGMDSTSFAGFGQVARYSASVEPRIGLISHVGGNSVSNVTRFAVSDASNVTFSLSTAAGAATLLASVATAAAGGSSLAVVSHVGGNVVSSVTRLAFSNDSNVTFSLSTAAGAATLMASVSPPGAASFTVSGVNGSFDATAISFGTGSARVLFGTSAGSLITANCQIAISAGTRFAFASNIAFADANGVSFTYNGTAISGSIGRELAVVSHVGGNSVDAVRTLAFSDANNVTFSLSTAASGATLIGSVAAPVTHTLAVSAAGASASAGTVVWSNSNNVSFGQAGSTVTATATFADPQRIGLVSHIGGNAVSSVSLLAFSNASNVTFSLSTAANAATLIASVGAAGGGATKSRFTPWAGAVLVDNQWGQNSLVFCPMDVPAAFQHDRVAHPIQISTAAVTATQSFTIRYGIYTRNASTLSMLSSTSFTSSINVSNTVNSTAWSGLRMVTMGWTNTVSAGDYWLAVVSSTASAGGAFSVRNGMYSNSGITLSGFLGAASNATNQAELGRGYYSATTGSLPASVAFSQIQLVGNGLSAAWRNPAFFFVSQTA